MNHFTFSACIAFPICLLAAVAGLLRGPKSKLNRIFAAHWFSIAFWAFFVGWQADLIQRLGGFWWGWLLHLGCVLIPTFFLHFAFEYSGETGRARRILTAAYVVSIAYLALNLATGFFTGETVFRDAYAYPKPALLYPMYFVTFVASIIYGTLLMIRAGYKAGGETRQALFIYLAGHALGYGGSMDNFLIMADIRIFPLYPFGVYLVAFYGAVAFYVVQRRHFLESAPSALPPPRVEQKFRQPEHALA